MLSGDLFEQVEEGLWEEVSDDGAALSGHIDYELDDSALWQDCESVAINTMLSAPASSQGVLDSWMEEENERVQGHWISVTQVTQTEHEQYYEEHLTGIGGSQQLEQEAEPQPTIEREPTTRRKHRKGATGGRPVLSRGVLNQSLVEAIEKPLFFVPFVVNCCTEMRHAPFECPPPSNGCVPWRTRCSTRSIMCRGPAHTTEGHQLEKMARLQHAKSTNG